MPANSVIQLRRGTAAQWTSANPVLANGEPGYETDTGKEKRGDGTTAWTSLAYFTPGTGTFAPVSNTATPFPASNGTDDTAALQALLSVGGHFAARRGETYKVSSLVPANNSHIDLTGATINQIAGSTGAIFYYSQAAGSSASLTNVTIRGGTINCEAAPTANRFQGAVGIYQGRKIRVENMEIHYAHYFGIQCVDSADVSIVGNKLYDCTPDLGGGQGARNPIHVGSGNFNDSTGFGKVFIHDNYVENTGGAGIGFVMVPSPGPALAPSVPSRAIITSNIIRNAPSFAGVAVESNGYQHDVVVANNQAYACGAGVFASDTGTAPARATDAEALGRLVISGNVIDAETMVDSDGITCTFTNAVIVGNSVRHTRVGLNGGGDPSSSPVRRAHSLNVVGNVFIIARASGTASNNISIGTCNHVSVLNNQVYAEVSTYNAAGIIVQDGIACSVMGNLITAPGNEGIKATNMADGSISGNTIIDPNSVAGSFSGIRITGTTGTNGLAVIDNVINDRSARMVYGIDVVSVTAGNVVRTRTNTIFGAVTGDVSNAVVANYTINGTNGVGDLTNGSPTMLNATGTYYAGQGLTGTGIAASTTVSSVSGTTVTLSANATATGTAVALTNASPYVFRNLDGHDMDVIVQGGTVTAVNVARVANGTFYATGLTNGLFHVGPREFLLIAASVVPTVRRVPRPG